MNRTILSVCEALARLSRETGEEWTEDRFFDCASQAYNLGDFFLLASPPDTATAYLARSSKTWLLGWQMARLWQADVIEIWQRGEAEASHVAEYDDMEAWFDPPARITRACVRISSEMLERIYKQIHGPVSSDEAVQHQEDAAAPDEELAALFDPVPVEALEKMFPADGRWESWAERARSNGLRDARTGRKQFNPYRAAVWFFNRGRPGWDWARCLRILANNLPAKSRDHKHLLTGRID